MNQLPALHFSKPLDLLLEQSPLSDRLEHTGNPITQWLGRALAQVWAEFEEKLQSIAIVKAVNAETITRDLYLAYLRNMRQQVSQGGRWITRAASSMENSHLLLRTALIRHAAQEHQDFTMLEDDYRRMGGSDQDMNSVGLNIGSQALSSFIMYEATKPNPAAIFGATFIIEGLGSTFAGPWSQKIQRALGVTKEEVKFLHYHGEADHDHYDNLVKVLSSPFFDAKTAIETRRIAKVVGRLYVLQLEELDNY